ncbi:hypothetical protein DPMN_155905 [Dreissena polymorpha]|uniref:Uncharacterized protein n=1 Tax=Dreissena polymorpha TaxID=45954 RepID=A0A9D4FUL0_DREPO|nr:hypothetical protein DPMN_155905 [Dreissena polymorpha]
MKKEHDPDISLYFFLGRLNLQNEAVMYLVLGIYLPVMYHSLCDITNISYDHNQITWRESTLEQAGTKTYGRACLAVYRPIADITIGAFNG